MSSPSDKHMESAKALLIEVEAMPSDGNAHIIAAALANAEREGMRRAAEIAREYGDFEPDCPHGEGFWRACDNLAAAILSKANSNSPDTLPVEADSASGAVCSSPAPVATPSKAAEFLEAALTSSGDDCIEWPFYKYPTGYGYMYGGEETNYAHRRVCERAHGPCPPGKSDAAHSCGNRACVNPRHLRWATRSENEQDKLAHGTYYARATNAKLDEDTVRAIRHDASCGASHDDLSRKYSTPKSTIKKVVYRCTWKHVDPWSPWSVKNGRRV